LDFIDWLCTIIANDPSIDNILFLGDWFENRSNINVLTLIRSYQGMKKLNDIGLPIFFVVGNHDLYHRDNRSISSVLPFNEFNNVTVIDTPTRIEHIGNGILMCPFLFHDEYPQLVQYLDLETWWGHFEFKDFIVTGYNIVLQSGPDHKDFKGPTYIVSGHFHKRQAKDNTVYLGNTFPTSFSDAGDKDRGCMTYDHTTKEMFFYNWEECPQYIKTTLSNILDEKILMPPKSRVKCTMDIPLSFEESTAVHQTILEKHKLREFILEEPYEITSALSDTLSDINAEQIQLSNVDDLVLQMLNEIKSDHIDNNMLVQIYRELK